MVPPYLSSGLRTRRELSGIAANEKSCEAAVATGHPIRNAAVVRTDRTDADERAARIGLLLDELRLDAEDLTELAKQAVRRVLLTVQHPRADVARPPRSKKD